MGRRIKIPLATECNSLALTSFVTLPWRRLSPVPILHPIVSKNVHFVSSNASPITTSLPFSVKSLRGFAIAMMTWVKFMLMALAATAVGAQYQIVVNDTDKSNRTATYEFGCPSFDTKAEFDKRVAIPVGEVCQKILQKTIAGCKDIHGNILTADDIVLTRED